MPDFVESSPIEWRMERALCRIINDPSRYANGFWHVAYLGLGCGSFQDFPPLEVPGIIIGREVEVGPYRADFGIFMRISGGIPVRLAVECDGHFFHEKTVEQAKHDKSRDRYFLNSSVFTVRFTGSEIVADADKCAEEAISIAAKRSSLDVDDNYAI